MAYFWGLGKAMVAKQSIQDGSCRGLEGVLEALGGVLEGSWGHLGAILGHLGTILAPSWAILGLLGAKNAVQEQKCCFSYGF